MFASGKHILMGLTLCAAGIMSAAPTITAAAAPAAPTIAVTAHVDTIYLPGSYDTVPIRRLTMHITGSNFTPGDRVRLAVINTLPWKVLASGSARAQPARTMVICGHDFKTCVEPNPRAGAIDYRVRLDNAPAAPNLQVLYRSGADGGMQGLTLR